MKSTTTTIRSSSKNKTPLKSYNIREASDLIHKASHLLSSSHSLLDEAREIATKHGLSVDSSILDASYQSPFLPSYFEKSINNAITNNFSNATIRTSTAGNSQSATTMTPSRSATTTAAASSAQYTKRNDTINTINPPSSILAAFPPILSTTGGHSNTDHIIQYTGNCKQDTISDYKRKLKRRMKDMQPEVKGTDRWDQPRIAGSRRRRILREVDLPCAPPEPPPCGYVIYIGQMTTKIRHDRPNEHHNQIKVVREISKIWKFGMSDDDRRYYNDFCKELREQYDEQFAEYKATGSYKPSKIFERLHGDGPWVRIAYHEKNSLEREISGYDSVKFPPRPEDMPKPEWVRKIEKGKAREMERRKAREERAKKKREKERIELEEAHREKARRLKWMESFHAGI